MGLRRTLQLALILAATIAILLAFTGVPSSAGATPLEPLSVIWSR